jgi:fibronectin type 3 domain-containing protein
LNFTKGEGPSCVLPWNALIPIAPRRRLARARTVGTASAFVIAATITLLAAPAAPTNLTATPGGGQITLSWNAVPTATSYRVYRATTGSFTRIATISTTSYTNTGLGNATTYKYYVRARNNSGEGPASPTVTVTTLPVPTAPASLSAVGGDRQIALAWPAVSTATSYRVYRSLTSNS